MVEENNAEYEYRWAHIMAERIRVEIQTIKHFTMSKRVNQHLDKIDDILKEYGLREEETKEE